MARKGTKEKRTPSPLGGKMMGGEDDGGEESAPYKPKKTAE